MQDYKKYIDELNEQDVYASDPAIMAQAKKVYDLQKALLVKKYKDLAKSSGGIFSPARKAAKEKAKLIQSLLAKTPAPKTDNEILKIAGLESDQSKNVSNLINDNNNSLNDIKEDMFLESSGFIKYLMKKYEISKEKAEEIWNKASKSVKKTPKYKDKKGDDKFKLIAGIAKKIAQNKFEKNIDENGFAPAGNPGGQTGINMAGFSPTILASDVVPPDQYIPYKAMPLLSRKLTNKPIGKHFKNRKRNKNESIEVNNFIDKLFEKL